MSDVYVDYLKNNILRLTLLLTKRAISIGLSKGVEIRALYFQYNERENTLQNIESDSPYEEHNTEISLSDENKEYLAVCKCFHKKDTIQESIKKSSIKKFKEISDTEIRGIVATPILNSEKKIIGIVAIDCNEDYKKLQNINISNLKITIQVLSQQISILFDILLPNKDKPLPTNKKKSMENNKVFISHSSKQKSSADDLHLILESAGYEPVLDSYDISGGQNIPERIATLIKESKYFILLLTEESLDSSWVMSEITLAYSFGLLDDERLLPVQLNNIDEKRANSIPWIPRNTYNWLDGTKGLRPVVKWLESKK